MASGETFPVGKRPSPRVLQSRAPTLTRGLMPALEPLRDPRSRAASGREGRDCLPRLRCGWGKGVICSEKVGSLPSLALASFSNGLARPEV